MAVCSDGSYGVPEGLISGFPCTTKNGVWSIVPGLDIDEFSRRRIDATVGELGEERDAVAELGPDLESSVCLDPSKLRCGVAGDRAVLASGCSPRGCSSSDEVAATTTTIGELRAATRGRRPAAARADRGRARSATPRPGSRRCSVPRAVAAESDQGADYRSCAGPWKPPAAGGERQQGLFRVDPDRRNGQTGFVHHDRGFDPDRRCQGVGDSRDLLLGTNVQRRRTSRLLVANKGTVSMSINVGLRLHREAARIGQGRHAGDGQGASSTAV